MRSSIKIWKIKGGEKMKKRRIIYGSTLISFLILILVGVLCFFLIPRITYHYEQTTESYSVHKVYGNAKSYTIKSDIQSKPITKINARAFMDKTNLRKIELKETITEVERMSFKNCKKLEKIDLTHIETIGRNAFQGCISLEDVSIEARYIDGGAFMECKNLSAITLNRTSIIGSYAFAYTNIEEIIIPSTCHTLGVDAFYQCSNLKKIIVKSPNLKNNAYLNSLDIVEFLV